MGFGSWLKDKASAAYNATSDAVGSAAEAVGSAAKTVGRTVEVAGQGLVKGVASGTASIGDLAVNVGYNWTTRNLINVVKEDNLEQYNTNLAGRAAEAVTWTEPKNDYERAVMAGGQVVGEVGAFVAVTVATAGVGGAAVGTLALARGGTATARAVSTGSRAAGATARFLNPLASKTGATIEAGVAGYSGRKIYTTDKNAEANAQQIETQLVDGFISEAKAEQELLQEKLQEIQTELKDIITQFESGELTAVQHDALLDRMNELKDGMDTIDELRTNISEERRTELHEKLENIVPSQTEVASNETRISTDATRPENAGKMSNKFTGYAYGETKQPQTPAPAPALEAERERERELETTNNNATILTAQA